VYILENIPSPGYQPMWFRGKIQKIKGKFKLKGSKINAKGTKIKPERL
jgi:hypothetical protein